MPLKTHGCVHFHDERVVFVQSHEISDEALKERDVVAPWKIKFDAAKRFGRPIPDAHSFEAELTLLAECELPQRLQAVKGAGIAAGHQVCACVTVHQPWHFP